MLLLPLPCRLLSAARRLASQSARLWALDREQAGGSGRFPALAAPLASAPARSLFTSPCVKMPTVGVNRDLLFKKLGRVYSECSLPGGGHSPGEPCYRMGLLGWGTGQGSGGSRRTTVAPSCELPSRGATFALALTIPPVACRSLQRMRNSTSFASTTALS
jgi:hypothetical protein